MKNGWEMDEKGNECHYVNDKLHREDGPAILYTNGVTGYFYQDKFITYFKRYFDIFLRKEKLKAFW